MTVLLTGATGFLGGELLARLIADTDHDVLALVRARDDDAAQARLDEHLAILLPPGSVEPGRVRAVAAHLDRPGLGLPVWRRIEIARETDAVVHCAASVQFTLPLEEALRINLDGTREILDIAGRADGLDRFIHVSTAYVAGDRGGAYREDEFDVGQRCRNTYEKTKLAAELHVLSSGLPGTSIVRPSVQRHLLADPGVRARAVPRRARRPGGPARHRPGRHGRRCAARARVRTPAQRRDPRRRGRRGADRCGGRDDGGRRVRRRAAALRGARRGAGGRGARGRVPALLPRPRRLRRGARPRAGLPAAAPGRVLPDVDELRAGDPLGQAPADALGDRRPERGGGLT
jgi:NAD(P)-dependent dehydrogenase (short-subunit alcohol dehydrogenase family)